ncbi:MAG: H/ACA ribonucleoprotein complex subunit GAR1 [Candidatus Heimdallarchaeaceae archaeon]|nr:hypothetical protein [Candidatus Heimdallarchaeota archaeon]
MERDKIKKLGNIQFFSDLGLAVIKDPPKLPRIRSNVVNEKMEHVGSVHDIFGPVKTPYVSIKVKQQYKEILTTDTVLYAVEKQRRDVRQQKKKYSQKKYSSSKKRNS